MDATANIQTYDSLSPAYHRAFETFLAHTDQKVTARNWLRGLVDRLPSRRIFIDAGAGNGKVTAWFLQDFQHTIAIEPNPTLCDDLRRMCPTVEVIPKTIPEAQLTVAADFVLCSHVLYYIDEADWMAYLETLLAWVSPEGVLAVVVQNHDSDCMRMLGHFFNYRFNLGRLASRFNAICGQHFFTEVATVPAQVVTQDFDSAFLVAEFMLNLLPIAHPPPRTVLEDYMHKHFARAEGNFRFSCDQDFLTIRPRL